MFGDDIFREMTRMQREMDRMFNRLYGGPYLLDDSSVKKSRKAVCDLCETENGYVAAVELPGVDKRDINLDVQDDRMTVSVEQKSEKNDEDSHMVSSQSFFQSIALPSNADASKAKASYKNGILRVEFPKSKQLGRRIQIE